MQAVVSENHIIIENEILRQALLEVRSGQKQILARIEEMAQKHASVEAAIAHIATAFPDDGVDGHRRYHEAVIELVGEKRRLRQAIQEKTISGLVWAGLVFIASIIWHEIQRRV